MFRVEDKVFYSLDPAQVMGLVCYGEARGESFNGQAAIMHVIKNRVEHGGWFLDADLINHGLSPYHAAALKNALVDHKSVYQFSCFAMDDPNRDILKNLAQSPEVNIGCSKWPFTDMAWPIINDQILDNTNGALYYYNPKVCTPKWAATMVITAQIGKHIFLKEGKK